MRITSLKIKNFRQYKDLNIKFGREKRNEIYSIIGQNGIGKTNILNSVSWCLYNKEAHLGDEDRSLVLPNLDTLKNVGMGNIITVKVEIEVEEKNGARYLFVREADFKKNKASAFELDNKFYVVTGEKGRCNESVEGEMANTVLNWCFPEKISDYFFFDGEKLDKYFEKDTASSIQMSILEISDAKILKTIKERLETLIKEKNREASKLNPDLEKLNQRCDLIESKIIKNKEGLETTSSELSKADNRIAEISRNLKGIADVKELEERRDKCGRQIKGLENDIKNHKTKIKEFIREYTVLISLYPRVKVFLDRIIEKKKKGQFPPSINKKILEDTLKAKTCEICGADLIEDGINKISKILEEISFSTGVSNLLSNQEYPLEAVVQKVKKFKDKKSNLLEELKKLEKSLNDVSEDKDMIDKKLSSFPDSENIKLLQTERSLLEEQSKQTRKNLATFEANADRLRKDYDDAVLEYEKAKDKVKGLEKINRELNFLEKSKRIVEESFVELLDEIRDKIRQETEEIFLKLIWKKDTFRNITLDKNYRLQLFNVDGYECTGSCSAAERSFLALAFTLALHKISGFNAPLVIDTPISRVSDKNRHNFANILKEVSLEKQIVLLFTPSEYSEEIKGILEPINGFKLQLETINEKETRIGEAK